MADGTAQKRTSLFKGSDREMMHICEHTRMHHSLPCVAILGCSKAYLTFLVSYTMLRTSWTVKYVRYGKSISYIFTKSE